MDVHAETREAVPIERNRYFDGKLLSARDLGAEQHYGVARRQLVNRALFGWGVIHGLQVELAAPGQAGKPGHVLITPGFALDRHGAEIFLPRREALLLNRAFRQEESLSNGQWRLSAHYAERPVEPVAPGQSCGCERPEFNRVREGVVFSLTRLDGPWQPPDPCSLVKPSPNDAAHKDEPLEAFVCQTLAALPDGGEIGVAGRLTCPWHGWCLDPKAGVPLAILELSGEAECPEVRLVEACAVRRFAYRNDLLFQLIAGQQGHLTRIASVSWKDWHLCLDPPVPYQDFRDAFVKDEARGFKIRFTGPVRESTLTEAAFIFTLIFPERAEHVDEMRRLRLHIKPVPEEGDPPGTASGVRIRPVRGWYEGEVVDIRSYLDRGAMIEIEVRGDLIIDACGRALDAEAIDFPEAATGNGVPGGTFLSAFRVAPRRGSGAGSSYEGTQDDRSQNR